MIIIQPVTQTTVGQKILLDMVRVNRLIEGQGMIRLSSCEEFVEFMYIKIDLRLKEIW
jgi:hypothetical protein